ncbi:MAG: cellulase family glycosylhydrolase [Chloroflexi bacterium]|nr:cellulase family glycosylhydrolase [Chloroflexota bacterium]
MKFRRLNISKITGIFIFTAVFALALFFSTQSKTNVRADETTATYTVNLPAVLNYFNIEQTAFGIQMYTNTGADSKYYDAAIASKAAWIRAPIYWNNVEPVDVSPSAYDFSSADKVVAIAQPNVGSPNMLVTIEKSPDWAASAPGAPIYSSALPDFAEFVSTMVERYDGDGVNDAPGSLVVNYWEFFNEPDSGWDHHIRGWGDDGDQYALMLATVYPVVKAANPNAKVVFGGIAYDWFEDQNGPFVREFLDDVLSNNGGNYFDVMNFHTYPIFNYNWVQAGQPGPGLREKTTAVRNKLAAYGFTDKPIIISESGWHSNNPVEKPSSPENQSRYVVELFTQSLASDVDVMIWWMLYDPGTFYWDNGLVTINATPKQSFTTFQTTIAKLGHASYIRTLTNGETGTADMEAYEFENDLSGQTLYVAWLDPVDTTAVKNLQLPATQATVYDIYGNVKTVIYDGVDGRVTVSVGGQPIYVEITQ